MTNILKLVDLFAFTHLFHWQLYHLAYLSFTFASVTTKPFSLHILNMQLLASCVTAKLKLSHYGLHLENRSHFLYLLSIKLIHSICPRSFMLYTFMFLCPTYKHGENQFNVTYFVIFAINEHYTSADYVHESTQ